MRGQAGPRRGYVELTLGCLGTRSQRDEHVSTRRCWAPQMEVRSHGTIKERNRGAIARFVATRFVHTQSLRARCENNQELPPQHGAGFAAVMLAEGGRPSVASEPASGGFAAGIPGQGGPQSIASETASGGLAAVQMKGGPAEPVAVRSAATGEPAPRTLARSSERASAAGSVREQSACWTRRAVAVETPPTVASASPAAPGSTGEARPRARREASPKEHVSIVLAVARRVFAAIPEGDRLSSRR